MSRFRPSILILTIAFAFLGACDKMSLVSPTGSTITLTINKTSVPINGTAEITAAVIESAGTPVQNGTVVTFTSSFGTVEPREARTEGGTARVMFTGTASGTAKIGAFSGGAKTAADVEIRVGTAAAETLRLRAEPPTIPQAGGTSQIVVTVNDASGGPLSNAPVVFTTDGGSVSPGTATTDATGEARTTLTTTRTSKVTATVGTKTGEVTVTLVNAPTVTISCPTGTAAAPNPAGVPITCTVTATPATGGSSISNVTVNWGDGTGEQPLGNVTGTTTVSHTYANPGVYTATASATDQNGQRSTASTSVNVQRVLPTATLTCPATANAGQPASFTVTPPANPTVPIQNVTVDFGDGTSRNLGQITGPTQFTKIFGSDGGYTVTSTVTDSNGQRGTSSCAVIVGRAPLPTVTLVHNTAPARAGQVEAFTVTAAPGTGGPPIANVRVTLHDGTVLYNANTGGSFTFTAPQSGDYVFTSVVTDTAGNQGNHILVLNFAP